MTCFDVVAAQFSQAEIVELTLICAFFNMFNRITDSLQIPIEIPGEVDLIRSSVDLDPDKVRTYLGTLVANWPSEFPTPSD